MRGFRDIAELTNTKHLNGGLVVRCAAGLPFLFEPGMRVHIVPPVLDVPRQLTVADAEASGVDGGVVWFEEVASANEALPYVGCHCLVERALVEQLAAQPAAFDAEVDIVGWDVYEVDGNAGATAVGGASGAEAGGTCETDMAYAADAEYIGVVKELREMPGQLMLIIDRNSCEDLMVPLVDEFVADVDEASKALRLRLPVGLLSL